MIHLKLKIKNVHNDLFPQPIVLVDLGVSPFSVSEETASMKPMTTSPQQPCFLSAVILDEEYMADFFLEIHTNGQLPAGQEALNSFLFEGKWWHHLKAPSFPPFGVRFQPY